MEEEKRNSISNTTETPSMESSTLRFFAQARKPFSPPQSPPPSEKPPSSTVRFLPGERNSFSCSPPTESPPLGNENPTSRVRLLPGERKQTFYSPSQSPSLEDENHTSPVRFLPGERQRTFYSPPRAPPPPLENENPTSPVQFLPEDEKPFSPPPQPPPPESPQSPVRFYSKEKKPFSLPPPESPLSKAIVPVDQRSYGFSPKKHLTPPETPLESIHGKPTSPVIVVNRSIREELSVMTKMDHNGEDGYPGGVGRREDVGNRNERRPRHLSSIIRRDRKEEIVKRAALGFRLCAVIFCLISFSVMAANRTRGWAGDSFDRYKEYRYCISVTIIGFVYSSFQAYDLAYNLVTEKHVIPRHFGYYFDFSMDQIMTYLLISATSSAATRVDDWQTNWGKDEFTEMASASIGMSFMAFFAFAFSSLISGYNLCTRNYH